MNLTIETTPNVLGRTDESPVGKKLFVVTWIDSDDSEDTKIELWIANSYLVEGKVKKRTHDDLIQQLQSPDSENWLVAPGILKRLKDVQSRNN